MTVSSAKVRRQNSRVHVPDYGSSHVAVKLHENCKGTREINNYILTSKSSSPKIFIGDEIVDLELDQSISLFCFSLFYVTCQDASGDQRVCARPAVPAASVPVTHCPGRRQVFIKSQKSQNYPLLDTDKTQARD